MTLRIYDSLARQKRAFEPLDPDHVRMYVCGPTVYDFAHIGNARPVVVFDTLYRLLKRLYPKVTYVRNITDVDDKIIAASKETGEPIAAITQRYADQYRADMAALNALPPDVEPRATDHIDQMIAMIEKLIHGGHAYAADGHVLFAVRSMAGYGALSRHSRDELIAGARVEVAPYKQDPADFVLWKPSSDDQPGWDSPWGRGRPGWHLECSAMSETHLGETFDIHGGGQDLIFPHHENEIAQSVCAHGGTPFVRYWMHNGYLTVDGEKMSKSLGNFYTVRQLLEEGFRGEAIRLALLSAHYRQPLDFSRQAMNEAKARLDRWYRVLLLAKTSFLADEGRFSIDDLASDRGEVVVEALMRDPELDVRHQHEHAVPSDVLRALKDDLNTPACLSSIGLIVDLAFRAAEEERLADLINLAAQLRVSAGLLGLLQQDPEDWFKQGTGDIEEVEIEDLIRRRAEARKNRNFKEADRIRDHLAAKGVVLEDSAGGTSWKRA